MMGARTDAISSVRSMNRYLAMGLGTVVCLLLLQSSVVTAAGPSTTPGERKPPAKGRLAFIDTLIQDGWKKAGVQPARTASDEEFMRRVYLDLVGRIPSPQESRAFLQTRESDKREKLIDYLLEHPDFAKNFANQWSVLLIGRSNQGRMVDRPSLNNWLRKQFLADRPWNEMVHELVASTGSNKENGAVNYVLAHLEFGAVPLTSLTTRLFMGQQIQCTQCHNHPSNDWKQEDFWGINAFFKGIKSEEVRKENANGLAVVDHTEVRDEPTDAYVKFDRRNGLVGIAFPKFLDGKKISQGPDVVRRSELAKLICAPNNGMLSKSLVNRMWSHFMGRGFVNPVDDMGSHNPPSHPELLDQLAKQFQESGYDVKQLCRWITSSRPYQLSSAKAKGSEKEENLFSQMQLKPMGPEQLFDSLLTATGALKSSTGEERDKKRDAWMRQFIFTFANDETEESSTFQGTIPQALMMMNGEIMTEAVSCKPGSFLHSVVESAPRQSRSPATYMVSSLYMSALSRHPSAKELATAGSFLEGSPDSLQVLQDLFWALLNSNEFILNH
jgi:hypothetical protein